MRSSAVASPLVQRLARRASLGTQGGARLPRQFLPVPAVSTSQPRASFPASRRVLSYATQLYEAESHPEPLFDAEEAPLDETFSSSPYDLLEAQQTGDVPDSTLLALLSSGNNEGDSATPSKPAFVTKVDAYITLRSRSPHLLASLGDDDLVYLAKRVCREKLAGVAGLMLQDLTSSTEGELDSLDSSNGYFEAAPGSARRKRTLQALLLAGNKPDTLFSPRQITRIFNMLREDFEMSASEEVEASQEGSSNARSSTQVDATIPPSFSIEAARRLLRSILLTRSPVLKGLLEALRQHLQHEPSFPTAREGMRLLRYYLDPAIGERQKALELFSSMAERQVFSEPLCAQAERDGSSWVDWALAKGGEGAELEQPAFEITVRSAIVRLLMHLDVFSEVPDALDELVATVRGASDFHRGQNETDEEGLDLEAPLATPLRLFGNFLHLLLSTKESRHFTYAFHSIERFTPGLSYHLDPRLIESFCEAAFEHERPKRASQVLTMLYLSTDKQRPPAILKPLLLIRVAEELAARRRGDLLARLISIMEEVVLEFPEQLRPRFVTALAQAKLRRQSRYFYEQWSEVEDGDPEDPLPSANGASPGLAQAVTMLRRVPLSPRAQSHVVQSAGTMYALIRLFGRPECSEEDQAFAQRVLNAFKETKSLATRAHYDLTTLAAACFVMEDTEGAFDAFSDLLFRRDLPDAVDVSVLLGGLARADPLRAVRLFRTALDPPTPGVRALQPTSSMYAVLMQWCLRYRRDAAAAELLEDAKSRGLADDVAIKSLATIFRNDKDKALNTAFKVEALVKQGWTPEPSVLAWMCRCAVRGIKMSVGVSAHPQSGPSHFGQRQMGGGDPPARKHKTNDGDIRAALLLHRIMFQKLGYVHEPTSRLLLNKLRAKGIWMRQEMKQRIKSGPEWQRAVDEVLMALRWAPSFDTGYKAWDAADSCNRLANVGREPDEPSVIGATSLPTRVSRITLVPNALSLETFRAAVLAYIKLIDIDGGAEVAAWMREDERMDAPVEMVREVRDALGRQRPGEAEMFTGRKEVPRRKVWWKRPGEA